MRSHFDPIGDRIVERESPRSGPSVVAALLGLALGTAFCRLAAASINPGEIWWSRSWAGLPLTPWAPRMLLFTVSLWNGVLGVLVAVAYFGRAWSVLGLRLGWNQVRESEGPCFLTEGEAGVWTLVLPLTTAGLARRTCLLPAQSGSAEPEYELAFDLEEGDAGAVRNLFTTGEVLRLRWCDLSSGGDRPILLRIQASRAAASTSPPLRKPTGRILPMAPIRPIVHRTVAGRRRAA
jgi:hypothetical protein